MDHCITLQLANYRCFSDPDAVSLRLRPGFTALVGVNNSGKSALLRFFFEFRDQFQRMGKGEFYASLINRTHIPFDLPAEVRDRNREIFSLNSDDPLRLRLTLDPPPTNGTPGADTTISAIDIEYLRTNPATVLGKVYSGDYALTVSGNSWQDTGGLLRPSGEIASGHNWRTFAQAASPLANVLYLPAFRNAVNAGGSGTRLFDMVVGQSFVQQWRELKQGFDKTNNIAMAELTTSICRVLGFRSLSIDTSRDNTTLQLVINDLPYRLDEVGSGISQFVLALTSAAIKKPDIILIDEPELNLHPSLQVDFLLTLARYAKYGVVFATHCTGLARAVADQIYSVTRAPSGASRLNLYEATPRLSELLGAMQYGGYSQLGFRTVLLVEGPSDVRTAHQFLRLYNKEHQVVVLPLGGGSLIRGGQDVELGEITRISDRVFALIDSERDAKHAPLDRSRAEFTKTCAALNIRCHVTERRCTETYFPERAIQRAFPDFKGGGFQPFERVADVPWGKTNNWRVAREMTRAELDATDLGAIFAQL